jgi:hypothetical protein
MMHGCRLVRPKRAAKHGGCRIESGPGLARLRRRFLEGTQEAQNKPRRLKLSVEDVVEVEPQKGADDRMRVVRPVSTRFRKLEV